MRERRQGSLRALHVAREEANPANRDPVQRHFTLQQYQHGLVGGRSARLLLEERLHQRQRVRFFASIQQRPRRCQPNARAIDCVVCQRQNSLVLRHSLCHTAGFQQGSGQLLAHAQRGCQVTPTFCRCAVARQRRVQLSGRQLRIADALQRVTVDGAGPQLHPGRVIGDSVRPVLQPGQGAGAPEECARIALRRRLHVHVQRN